MPFLSIYANTVVYQLSVIRHVMLGQYMMLTKYIADACYTCDGRQTMVQKLLAAYTGMALLTESLQNKKCWNYKHHRHQHMSDTTN